jgi:arylsulfatase
MLLGGTILAAASVGGSSGVSPAQAPTAPAPPPGGKPNVVFILADNVGYGDLGPYGGGELRGAPTPRIDQLAREGLKLTQFLVEPACTSSRAALMTGRYSIREGLSLVLAPGTENTLSAKSYTMGDMLHGLGYATAIFGKWRLGSDAQSLPTAHGFDEYYGIPPDLSWDASMYADEVGLSHAIDAPPAVLAEKGPHVVEGTLGSSLREVKPFSLEVRANIDVELVDKSIDFMRRQHAAGKPFFLYLPFSMGHYPNLPAKEFAGKSRIGHYGDKLMEGDHYVGQILDALKELGIDNDTIVIFCSDNGPSGTVGRELGNLGTPDLGSGGPFRGELGDATEGSIRTFAFVRWPGHVPANSSSYAMFSIMDFFPTLASIVGGRMPTDRPIDGVDQSDVLFGKSTTGHHESLLSFIGPVLVAARWKQFRAYSLTCVRPVSGRSLLAARDLRMLSWQATPRFTISKPIRMRT